MHRDGSAPDATSSSVVITTLDGQDPLADAGAAQHQVGWARTSCDVLPGVLRPFPEEDAERCDADGASRSAPGPASETGGRGSDWPARVAAMDEAELRRLVVSLPLIEQAKGVLMAFYGCDAERAFAILRRWSSVHHVKVSDLAAAIAAHTESQPPHRGDDAGADGPVEEWRSFHAVRAFVEQTGLG